MARYKLMTAHAKSGRRTRRAALVATALVLMPVALGGCQSFTRTTHHGYILSEEALDQVPVGSSQAQAQFALGTPSTTATFGNEVWYYISQKEETTAFLAPKIVDQRVLAVYFDKDSRVSQIANYGLEDGRVVDFIGRTTPTTGQEVTLLKQIFSNAIGQNVE